MILVSERNVRKSRLRSSVERKRSRRRRWLLRRSGRTQSRPEGRPKKPKNAPNRRRSRLRPRRKNSQRSPTRMLLKISALSAMQHFRAAITIDSGSRATRESCSVILPKRRPVSRSSERSPAAMTWIRRGKSNSSTNTSKSLARLTLRGKQLFCGRRRKRRQMSLRTPNGPRKTLRSSPKPSSSSHQERRDVGKLLPSSAAIANRKMS